MALPPADDLRDEAVESVDALEPVLLLPAVVSKNGGVKLEKDPPAERGVWLS